MNWYKKAELSEKEPWEMSEQEFLDYHKTGDISSEAYENSRTVENLNWLEKNSYPIFLETQNFTRRDKSSLAQMQYEFDDGPREPEVPEATIEFRQSGRPVKYVKHDDEKDDIMRDENGEIVYLSEEEMTAKSLPLVETSVVAFDGDVAVGYTSDEWGADGVWVIDSHQSMGIGVYLLSLFRQQFKSSRKIGQMTPAGVNMTRSYYRELMKEHTNSV